MKDIALYLIMAILYMLALIPKRKLLRLVLSIVPFALLLFVREVEQGWNQVLDDATSKAIQQLADWTKLGETDKVHHAIIQSGSYFAKTQYNGLIFEKFVIGSTPETNRSEQAGPGYPPQGVGSPDP